MPEERERPEGEARRDAARRHRLLEEITGGAHPVSELYHRSTDQLQAILDASPAIIYAKSLDGGFLFVNREFEKLFGVVRQNVIGRTDYDLFPSGLADEMRRNDQDVVVSGHPIEREEVAPLGDGPHTYLSLKFPLHDEAGAVIAVCGISMDITERKRAEEAVRQSERELRALAETVPQLVWTIGPDGELAYINQRWQEYTGLPPENSTRQEIAAYVHPDDLQKVSDAWAATSVTGTPFQAEYRLRGVDGVYRWFLGRGVPAYDGEGRISRWFGTSTDIDERKRGEAAQRLLADLGARMHQAADPDELLREVMVATGEHLGVTRCAYDEVNLAAETITIYPGYRLGGAAGVAGKYPLASLGPSVAADLAAGRTVVVADVARDPRTAREAGKMYAQVNAKAFIAAPVISDGRWVSLLIASMDDAPRDWTPDEAALLETVAERTWLAVENARLYRAERAASAAEEAANVQQRQFLRDVMTSVTDGRLALCFSETELPPPLPLCGENVPISRESGLWQLRRLTREAAEELGFADERWQDLVTAVGEAGMNAVIHAGGGEGRVCTGPDRIQVWITDRGLGIDMGRLPQAALRRGYTTAGTLGHGLKMVLQTADQVFLLTGPDGTMVVMEQNRVAPQVAW